MKKRNRILSLLLAGVMALGLTACGASNAGAAADETGSAAVSTESILRHSSFGREDYQRRCDQYHRQYQSPFVKRRRD